MRWIFGVLQLFYGRPEPVTYVAGGVGYGSHEYGHGHQRGGHQGPHYYSDGDDYYSQRHSRAPLRHTSGAPMLPVRLLNFCSCLQCVIITHRPH